MKRKSIYNNLEFEELEKPVDLTISTKVPSKWAFVDMETGDIWVKVNGKYERPNKEVMGILGKLVSKIDLSWLMKKAEESSDRFIENEKFLLELLEMNWFKRAFCSFGLILKFLKERYKV
jgi:hypothetical protein